MNNLYNNYNILVIGDSCIDKFIYGNVSKLAPEGPISVLNKSYEKSNPGMAANVKSNILAIGANCDLITNEELIVKSRYIDQRSNYILLRFDEDVKLSRINQSLLQSIKNNNYNNKHYDAIIISDYCKGFLIEQDIEFVSKNNKNVFLDTKKILSDWCKSVSYIKINHFEFEKTEHTLKKLEIQDKLIITHSENGCQYLGNIYPVEKVNVKDLSGAGDTFISALTCEYIRTSNIISSIKFAQKCATIVVQKKGVCTI